MPVLLQVTSTTFSYLPGTVELGSSAEDFLHATEVNEMKSVNTPLASTTILPSPVLLWRFKVVLFLMWGFACCKISRDSVRRMSANLRDLFLYEAFLYYNHLLLVGGTVDLFVVNTFRSAFQFL
ncbi:unnamed protein product [Cuscuta europaea]|uniref:Uncharacterized protein n=1 Tax=Cuscuta europaea TaxID=41803 RepID=A0A9P0ZF95_CUSEU|nr:unnamed protein product [Cuscuta europaea]